MTKKTSKKEVVVGAEAGDASEPKVEVEEDKEESVVERQAPAGFHQTDPSTWPVEEK